MNTLLRRYREVRQQIRDGLIALAGFLVQAFADDSLQFERDSGSKGRQRLRLIIEYGPHDGVILAPPEGTASCDHLIKHDAECPDVRPMIDVPACCLLG